MKAPDKVGNACNSIALASVLAYTVATFLYAKPGSTFFDDDWVQHGFCVIQKDIPYWNSHDLCLYFDIVLVALGFVVYFSLRGVPHPQMKYADEMMVSNLLGHLGHGVAHGFIGAKYRSGDDVTAQYITGIEQLAKEDDQMKIIKRVLVGCVFWFGLMRGVVPRAKASSGTIAILAIAIYVIGELFVTDVLGFAYVQAVIAVAFASTQLTLPKEEKDIVYGAFALASVPISFIPWIESTSCRNIASKLGGHLIYDISIPTLLTAGYYYAWNHYSSALNKKDKQA